MYWFLLEGYYTCCPTWNSKYSRSNVTPYGMVIVDSFQSLQNSIREEQKYKFNQRLGLWRSSTPWTLDAFFQEFILYKMSPFPWWLWAIPHHCPCPNSRTIAPGGYIRFWDWLTARNRHDRQPTRVAWHKMRADFFLFPAEQGLQPCPNGRRQFQLESRPQRATNKRAAGFQLATENLICLQLHQARREMMTFQRAWRTRRD